MKQNLASLANYTVAAALFVLALIYLFKSSFMPYHSQALSLSWHEIDLSTQKLILALMRVCGGGWLSLSLTIIFLQWHFSTKTHSWLPITILLVGMASIISTLYATLIVSYYTPGNPPNYGLIILIILLLTGYRLNISKVKQYQIT